MARRDWHRPGDGAGGPGGVPGSCCSLQVEGALGAALVQADEPVAAAQLPELAGGHFPECPPHGHIKPLPQEEDCPESSRDNREARESSATSPDRSK